MFEMRARADWLHGLRRDGVSAECLKRRQDGPAVWWVRFPPAHGAATPGRRLSTDASADPREEVDRLYPLPAWRSFEPPRIGPRYEQGQELLQRGWPVWWDRHVGMRRSDQLMLAHGQWGTGLSWFVEFGPAPPLRGLGWEVLRAKTSTGARREVDRRWPLPEWGKEPRTSADWFELSLWLNVDVQVTDE